MNKTVEEFISMIEESQGTLTVFVGDLFLLGTLLSKLRSSLPENCAFVSFAGERIDIAYHNRQRWFFDGMMGAIKQCEDIPDIIILDYKSYFACPAYIKGLTSLANYGAKNNKQFIIIEDFDNYKEDVFLQHRADNILKISGVADSMDISLESLKSRTTSIHIGESLTLMG